MDLTKDLKWIYKNLFLSHKIKKKYLNRFKKYKILAQNFVKNAYILVIESEEKINV